MRRLVALAAVVVTVATGCSFKAFDFNGDNKADYVWRDQTTGTWYEGSVPDAAVRYAGAPSDIPVSADYDGDGKFDIAVIKANGDWVRADGSVIKAAFPAPGASSGPSPIVPVPGDYDGDKKAEPAWFRTSDGAWVFADGTTKSISGGPTEPTMCCLLSNDGRVPVPADYDGDKKTDLAVWNPLTGDWTIARSSDGTTETARVIERMSSASPLQFPVPGDYDGVGHAQPAIIDTRGWHVAGHAEPIATVDADAHFPAQADYDGDGKTDPSTIGLDGRWRTQNRADDVITLSDTSSLRGVPAEFPVSLLYNVARITLLGRNLMECERTPGATCIGADPGADAKLLWIDRTTGAWHVPQPGFSPTASPATLRYQGAPTDTPVLADYDGDGRLDIAVVQADGDWVRADGSLIAAFPKPAGTDGTPTGVAPIVPVPADYDGDGKAEPAWYRSVDGTWFVLGRDPEVFGSGPTTPGGPPPGAVDADVPVPADYDGDHKADLARFNPRTGQWTIRNTTDASVRTTIVAPPPAPTTPPSAAVQIQFAVPADYDGVGHAQPAVFDLNGWHVEGHASADPFGAGRATFSWFTGLGAVPAVADYDRDGRADMVFVDAVGRWNFKGPGSAAMPALRVATSASYLGVALATPALLNQAQFANVAREYALANCLALPSC